MGLLAAHLYDLETDCIGEDAECSRSPSYAFKTEIDSKKKVTKEMQAEKNLYVRVVAVTTDPLDLCVQLEPRSGLSGFLRFLVVVVVVAHFVASIPHANTGITFSEIETPTTLTS